MKYATIGLILVTLAGCSATIPESLQVEENISLVSFQSAQSDIASVKGQQARWGGVIASMENKPNKTVLEVVNFELSSKTRPVKNDKTTGRFKVYINRFLDPVVYGQGRSVTFVGKVSGVEEGQVGEFEYAFPVLEADAIYLWKDIQKVDLDIYQHGVGYYPWGYPYWWHRPYHRRIVVTKSGSSKGSGNSRINSPVNKVDREFQRSAAPVKNTKGKQFH